MADLGIGSCSSTLTTASRIVHDSQVYAFNVRMQLVTDSPGTRSRMAGGMMEGGYMDQGMMGDMMGDMMGQGMMDAGMMGDMMGGMMEGG